MGWMGMGRLMKLKLLFFLIFDFFATGWVEISFHQYFAG